LRRLGVDFRPWTKKIIVCRDNSNMVAILEIFQLIALLYNYLLPLIAVLIGVLSFFFYVKSKKKGFVVLGIAFIIQATYLAFYNTVAGYFLNMQTDYILRANEFSIYSFTFAIIFAILLLLGIILLFNEVKPKTNPQLPDA
jgi:hypothetical protein